jgi:hypothetical protein
MEIPQKLAWWSRWHYSLWVLAWVFLYGPLIFL